MTKRSIIYYLATQAITDFRVTENEPLLDGVVFQSAQSKEEHNVVLFHKAARIEAMEFPKGTEIAAHSGYEMEDGWETDYSVRESVPALSASLLTKEDDDGLGAPSHQLKPVHWNNDLRVATLRVDPVSVEVHQVDWVKVQCSIYKVCRNRFEKQDCKF